MIEDARFRGQVGCSMDKVNEPVHKTPEPEPGQFIVIDKKHFTIPDLLKAKEEIQKLIEGVLGS